MSHNNDYDGSPAKLAAKPGSRRSPSGLAWMAIGFFYCAPAMGQTFDANSASLTNPLLPWPVGAQLTYTGSGDFAGFSMTIQVLGTQIVDGVNCVKVRRSYSNSALNYFDAWLAQDTTGNIWQLRDYDNPSGETEEDNVLFTPANPPLGAHYVLYSIYSTDYVVSSVSATVVTPWGRIELYRLLERGGRTD